MATLLEDLDADRQQGADVGGRLCGACIDILGVSGAGIMLMSGGRHNGTLAVSDAVIGVVEELQFTLGEGPCIDACVSAEPVFEPDLRDPRMARWPAFCGPAVEAGVRAVFGFPLRTGGEGLGALDVYLDQPGALGDEQVEDAIALAQVISTTVLSLQADATPGTLAPELNSRLDHRAVVHQASGMVSVQLGIGVADALARIRAHAYTSNRSVESVARDIVDRTLHLDRS